MTQKLTPKMIAQMPKLMEKCEGRSFKKHKAVMSYRFGWGEYEGQERKTVSETAKFFSVSQARIRQIEKESVEWIKWRLYDKEQGR